MAIYAAPTVGRLGILNQESAFNQAAIGLVAKHEIGYPFIFLLLKNLRDEFNNLANGAAQQNLNVALVKNYKTFIPDNKTLKSFNDFQIPIFEKIRSNSMQIQTLTKTRDELLQRLMSGEVRVKM
jgi:type I restriction enzyme S subunit